jgi:hypothetical protein
MLQLRWIGLTAALLLGVAVLAARLAEACPFCAAVSLTFCEEITGADVAVIAKLLAPAAATTNPAEVGKAKFEVVDCLKGDKEFAAGKKFEAIYFGDSPIGTLMLITGVDPANLSWQMPIPITPKVREYLGKALKLPKEGAERMVFFQDYLEDPDELLARDAYDEFAKTPYAGIKELKSQIKHDKLIGWIQNPKVAPSRRRLYLTMVGVCGEKQDAELLETMIRSDDRQVKSGLDALIAAYLTLKGPEGMPLIEDLFLKKQDADYTETYAAIMALRFHGQEEEVVSRPRLLEALHYMLDRPQLADLVIADLARWHDWGAMDRLVELFKNATDETIWVRVPVINFLQACPLPEAKERLAELAKIDPESVKKATSLFPIGGAPAARDKSTKEATDGKDKGGSEKSGSDKAEKEAADPSASTAGDPDVERADANDPSSNDPYGGEDLASDDSSAASMDATEDSSSADRASDSLVATTSPVVAVRLSRAGAPVADAQAPVEASRVLMWLALVGCGLGVAFWTILGGSRKTA